MPMLNRGWKRLGRAVKRRALWIEAAFYLLLSRRALKIVPFQKLVWFFGRPVKKPEITGAARQRITNEVCAAIWKMTEVLPGDIVCFPRAIAAQAMLRRRGVGTILCYGGITRPEKGLKTHAWVQDGEQGVIGFGDSYGYLTLAQYPSMD